MKSSRRLGIFAILLLQLLSVYGDDTITKVMSPVVSYRYSDALGTDANTQIISPIASCQYFDSATDLSFASSTSVSYFYNSGERSILTLTPAAHNPAAAFLAFNFPTDFEAYIFEYKNDMSESFWKVWRLIVGDGQVKTIIEDAKLNKCLFIRVRTESSPIRLKFPLLGTFSSERISGYRHGDHWLSKHCPNSSNRLLHVGLDLKANAEDIVYAVSSGTVRYAKADETWGGYLVLELDNGYTITYTHVIPSVLLGEKVAKGLPIGSIAPGNANFDSHLHFQLRKKAFSSEELNVQLRGRLPENTPCITVSGQDPDPAFPELFLDPETIFWE